MVLGYFGRHLYPSELSPDPVSVRDGVTAEWLTACARRQGLHAEGFEVSVGQLSALPTPAILHTTSSHFVVLEGIDHGRITIVDPSVGERWRLDEREARELVSGIALAFEPGPEFQRRSRVRFLLHALSAVSGLDRRRSALVATAGVAFSVLVCACGTEWLWQTLLGGSDSSLRTLTALERIVAAAALASVGAALLVGTVHTLVGLGWANGAAYPRHGPLGDGLVQPVERYASPHAAVIDSVGNPAATVGRPDISEVVVTASVLLGAAYSERSTGGAISILLAAFSGALAASLAAAYLRSTRTLARLRKTTPAAQVVPYAHLLIAATIWTAALTYSGALSSSDGGIQFPRGVSVVGPQVFLAVTTYRLGGALVTCARWLAAYKRAGGGLADGRSVNGTRTSESPEGADVHASAQAHAPLLRIHHVKLSLGDRRDSLLTDIDLDLHEGEHVAFVGPVGVGKSTLIKALLGRHRASPGTLLYCGRSLHEYSASDRDQLVRGIVQGERVADSTIARILRASRADASEGQLQTVCAQLGLDETISQLPLGYHTPVFFDGDTLSRGQRQMVLLAQTLASGARVLAFDDPVHALDDATAHRVLSLIATLPCAVVLTMASSSALRGLDFKVIRLGAA